MNLGGMSSDALEELARRAQRLAADLRKAEPTYELALENGVKDKTYSTVRYGRIPSYGGEALITMSDGRRWKAVGHEPRGSAEHVSKNGWIEFIPVEAA